DYYQPEAYISATDTYIEKDSSINDEIDLMRLSATTSLIARNDVIVVASISCIYGLGSPQEYIDQIITLHKGQIIERDEILKLLIAIQYERHDTDFSRSTFRVRGDIIDIHTAYAKQTIRVELFGDEITRIQHLESISGRVIEELNDTAIYPAKHFITERNKILPALKNIEDELQERLAELKKQGKDLEAHRLEQRTMYDLEMLREIGYCNGIENYSRQLSFRNAGDRPSVLLDYFPDDFLMFIDESHVALPQVNGMYKGDRSRKENLIDFGFRLPSALDNRPLYFEEFDNLIQKAVFISATPGNYELENSDQKVELIIRPTGLVDPPVEIHSSAGQIDDLLEEIKKTTDSGYRILVTTLTKKMSEELTDFLSENGIRVQYLHSEIETIERVEIIHNLRAGEFDCLAGINLLREGLDLPEVGLVAILDADKAGFLRSASSLIQISGRAARNIHGRVIMYADNISSAMKTALTEMDRRREKQLHYNEKHNITPKSIKK
ncbi:MAG: excinuclease ABC subunit UvrB, partial [Spirochaetes bacterium]|nr:excinuclease ABC subunit UvrB [Spirochaetota bacterium]